MKNLEEYNKLCPAQKRQEKYKFQSKNWEADDKLIKDINSHINDDYVAGNVIKHLITIKEYAEKNNLLDSKKFTGIGLKRKIKNKKTRK